MGRIQRCEKGVGLLETVIAAVILLLVALAGATIFYQGSVSTVNTKNASEAIHKAQERLEILRARGRTWIENRLEPPPPCTIIESNQTIGNDLPATATTTIAYVDDAADSLSTHVPPDLNPNDYLTVVVEIEWEENNQVRARRAGTIIR